MRTTKRFTPDILDFYRRQGRGTGTFESYIPWHCVSRSDPASIGRSHLLTIRDRHIELLSDVEFIVFCFATRLLTAQNDIREQFPLSLEESPHELASYDVRFKSKKHPGTLQIADNLNIKHPMTHGNGRSAQWVMTTDLLLMLVKKDGTRSLLAISVKDRNPLKKRAKALQQIERSYWLSRRVQWLLITPHEFHPLVAETLHRTWQWALSSPLSDDILNTAQAFIYQYQGHTLTYLLKKLAEKIGNYTRAQDAVWQTIWSGRVPVDLRRGWRPHIPLRVISQAEFDQLNPVFMRKSKWS